MATSGKLLYAIYFCQFLLLIVANSNAQQQTNSKKNLSEQVYKIVTTPVLAYDQLYEYDVYMTMRCSQVKITPPSGHNNNAVLRPYYWTPISSNDDDSFTLSASSWPLNQMSDTTSDLYRAVYNAFLRLNTIIVNNIDGLVVNREDVNITSISHTYEDVKVQSYCRVKSRRFFGTTLDVLARSVTKSAQRLMNSEWATDTFGLDGVWLDVTVMDKTVESSRTKKSDNWRPRNQDDNQLNAAATLNKNNNSNIFCLIMIATSLICLLVLQNLIETLYY